MQARQENKHELIPNKPLAWVNLRATAQFLTFQRQAVQSSDAEMSHNPLIPSDNAVMDPLQRTLGVILYLKMQEGNIAQDFSVSIILILLK